jgi:predicted phage gp36 major capsid-like protein
MPTLESVTTEIKDFLGKARDIADKAETENRDFTDAERAEITDLMKKAATGKKSLDQIKADAATRNAITDLGNSIGEYEPTATKSTKSGLIVNDGRKSIGDMFVGSQGYTGLVAGAPNGQFGEKMRIQGQPTGFTNLLPDLHRKSLITGSNPASAGNMVYSDRLGMLGGLGPFERPLVLRQVVTPGTTTSDTIEYAKVVSVTNNAAPVPEATTDAAVSATSPIVTAAQAGVKPQSGFTTVRQTAVVKTIAHWIPVTKRALADAAQVKTLIDSFLQYGLEEELEDQMVSGDGTGENFTGLAHTSGMQLQAWDTDALTTSRKAKTLVRLVGRSVPNAFVLNPYDVQTIDLLKDAMARYYFGGPATSGDVQTLWGLPVVESLAVPIGTGYVGDWTKAILWDRQQAAVTVTDSHEDFFVRNLVAVLAELRAAFGIIQPNAFVQIDLTA